MRRLVEREQGIIDAYLAGVKVREIMDRNGGSHEVVYRSLRRAGLAERRSDTRVEWWNAAAAMYGSGTPIAHIALEVGKSRRAVQYALTRIGLRKEQA